MIYIKEFASQEAYDAKVSVLNEKTVSLINDTTIEYGVVEPPLPDNVIKYWASAKLTETVSNKTAGLHTNAFNAQISNHTFKDGVGLITFDDDVTSFGDYAFYQSSGVTDIIIPASVITIGNNAFSDCKGLTNVAIPDNVTTIGQLAFSGCTEITSITFGNSVTTLQASAFINCTKLQSVTIPNSVTEIGNNVFSNCSGITTLTIGSGVTTIGEQAFDYCRQLGTIISLPTTGPSVQHSTFYNIKDNGTLYVPIGSTGYDYMYDKLSAYGWSKVEQ